jgi:hypothetical protein
MQRLRINRKAIGCAVKPQSHLGKINACTQGS